MARCKLNEAQKDRVVELYQANKKQTNIAKYFGVSPRTINRVLIERGMIEAPEDRELRHAQIIKICDTLQVTPEYLRTKLEQPELTYETFRSILGQLDPAQLGILLHGAILEAYEKKLNQPAPELVEQEEMAV